MINQELEEKFGRAMDALNQADFPAAIEILGELVVERPDHAEAWCQLGVCYLETGQPDLALEALTRAVKADPGHTTAHYILGNAYGTAGQLERAAACYRRALEIDPNHHKAEEFLIKAESLLESREHYRTGLKLLYSAEPTAHDLNQALRALIQSVAIFENSPARENLLECSRKLLAFKREWAIPVEVTPELERWAAACERGYQCVQFKNWVGARAAFDEALAYRVEDAFVHNALGFSFVELGEVDDAVRAWLRVLELDPSYDFARFGARPADKQVGAKLVSPTGRGHKGPYLALGTSNRLEQHEMGSHSSSAPERADYGIDAPPVVRNFILVGAACMILATAARSFFASAAPKLATVLFNAGVWTGAIFLAEAGLMVWSSKVGKLRERERLLGSMPWRGDEKVLDVGCGRGLLLIGAAKRLRTGKAIGVDIWQGVDQSGNRPEATWENARAEGVADRIDVTTADARQLPFPESTFDVIVSSLALHNIYNKTERDKALREVARVLKPGGRVAILDMRYTDEYAQVLRESGLRNAERSGLRFIIFPIRLVTGSKPASV